MYLGFHWSFSKFLQGFLQGLLHDIFQCFRQEFQNPPEIPSQRPNGIPVFVFLTKSPEFTPRVYFEIPPRNISGVHSDIFLEIISRKHYEKRFKNSSGFIF